MCSSDLPMLWFIAKVWCVMLFMIITRGTLVRLRYDRFMQLGWKVLIPVSLTWFVLVALVQGYRAFGLGSPRTLLLILAVVFLVAMLVLLLLPSTDTAAGAVTQRADDDVVTPADEIDALADGFPVPPLPGQALPLSPRAQRRAAGAVAATTAVSEAPVQEGHDD